jgi:hypothetical protein
MKRTTGLILFAFSVVLFGCKSDPDVEPLDLMQDYLPVKPGTFVVYNVDSIQFNLINVDTTDTSHFQIMEVIDEPFIDSEGRLSHRIERYRRDSLHHPWAIDAIWSMTRTDALTEKVEGNLRYIKLVFPPKEEKKWRGNLFINTNVPDLDHLGNWEYEYTSVEGSKLINGLIFPNTCTVLQHEESNNALAYTFSEEVYAMGVGMIQKRFWYLARDQFFGPWTEGFVMEMEVDTFGVQ